jgi:hypothetical protein
MQIQFSIILPLYKQFDQVDYLYNIYKDSLNNNLFSYELIFVVNGPEDGSFELLENLTLLDQNVFVIKSLFAGWGEAVKTGIEFSKGLLICYSNSARTDINELILMLRYSQISQDKIIKTTRVVRESIYRKIGSFIYNFIFRKLTKAPILDVNGTPKIIPKEYLDEITIFETGDLLDAEILAKMYRLNKPILEILVIAKKRIGGQSTTKFKSAIKMYLGLFRLAKSV